MIMLSYKHTLLTLRLSQHQFPDLHNSQHGSPLHSPHTLPQPYYAIFFVWIFPLALYLPNFIYENLSKFFSHSMVLVQLT